MNQILYELLLAGDTFMPEMHLRQPYLQIILVDHSQKAKKEYDN